MLPTKLPKDDGKARSEGEACTSVFSELVGLIDEDKGFLCMSMYWRPNPKASNPEMPGEKLSMISYVPLLPKDDCLCGSGKAYCDCCQLQNYWHPVCPNPRMQGYSLVRPQSATFQDVDGQTIRKRLMDSASLQCVENSFESSFWLFWGSPPMQNQYGILCFGDLELKENKTFLVSAMSDLRMQVLLDLLFDIAKDCLGTPQIRHDATPIIDKRTRKLRTQLSKRRRRLKRRKR